MQIVASWIEFYCPVHDELLSQPKNNHNPNNKITKIVVGLRLSNHWEPHSRSIGTHSRSKSTHSRSNSTHSRSKIPPQTQICVIESKLSHTQKTKVSTLYWETWGWQNSNHRLCWKFGFLAPTPTPLSHIQNFLLKQFSICLFLKFTFQYIFSINAH